MRVLCIALVGVALLTVEGTLSRGQLSQPFPAQEQQQPGHRGTDLPPIGPVDPLSPQMEAQQARSRNNDRQKRLVADTEKLLALATQLKQDVDKTNKDVMSVDVIKKADEIEKLAHSVKERMKG
jgi:hypothetical protein